MLQLQALRTLIEQYGTELERVPRPIEIAGRTYDFNGRRALMGVINLSSDSAYRESVCASETEAVERGRSLARQGADFIDIGAESSLPQAKRISPGEQEARIVPVVKVLAREGLRVSVESYHPQVLEAAAQAGAAIFNLTGIREEREVLRLASRFGAAVIHCYVQGETVRDATDFAFEGTVRGENPGAFTLQIEQMTEMVEKAGETMEAREEWFRERIALAEAEGVHRNILDPGLGFYYENLEDGALRVNHQLSTFLQTFRLTRLGYPTLNILPHAPEIFGEAYRRAAEPFFAVIALLGGTHILRTHELETVARIRQVMEGYPG